MQARAAKGGQGMAQDRPLAAAGAMLAGLVIIGFTDNYVRVIAEAHGLWQFHVVRSVMVAPLLLVGARMLGLRLWPRRPGPVAVRSLLHASAMLVYFGCLAVLPVAVVAAGLYTAPIFVLLIERFAFGIRFGVWRVLAVALGFAGVLLMLGPGTAGVAPGLVALPVGAAVLYGLGNLATRHWCDGESALTLTAGFFAALFGVGALGLAAVTLWAPAVPDGPAGFVLRGWQAFDGPFLFWTLVQATGSLVGVALMVRAYQMADTSKVSVFEYALLPIGAAWGFVLWAEVLPLAAWLGIALIFASGAVIALRSKGARSEATA